MDETLENAQWDFIGWEWDQAVQVASENGLELIQIILTSIEDEENSTLRIVRQDQVSEGIRCICVHEIWD